MPLYIGHSKQFLSNLDAFSETEHHEYVGNAWESKQTGIQVDLESIRLLTLSIMVVQRAEFHIFWIHGTKLRLEHGILTIPL